MNKKAVSILCFILILFSILSVPTVYADIELTVQVTASSDDTRVHEGGVAHPSWDSMAALTAKGLSAGYHAGNYYGSAFRFLNVTVPSTATIVDARFQLNCRTSTSAMVVNTRITGDDVANSNTFTNISDFNGRPRTTAYVDWDNIPAWSSGIWYDSPDITNIIEEIIAVGGWNSGNKLTLFWEDHGSTSSNSRYRQGYAYDAGASVAPKLVITYTVPLYLTFYHNNGGVLRVNNVTRTNGTEVAFYNNTVVELVAIIEGNNTYTFSNFTWDSNSNSSNPYNLTVTQNLTVWCYFRLAEVGAGALALNSTLLFLGMLMGLGLLFIIIGIMVERKWKSGSRV